MVLILILACSQSAQVFTHHKLLHITSIITPISLNRWKVQVKGKYRSRDAHIIGEKNERERSKRA